MKREMFTSHMGIEAHHKPIDLFAERAVKMSGSRGISLSSAITGGESGRRLDIESWLPLFAPVYNISADIKDYIIVPTTAILTEIPNTNGDSMSMEEMLRILPEHGKPAYATFRGKPTFVEHNNKDHTKASGIIFDSFIAPLTGFQGNHAKVILLLGFCRQADPESAKVILSGEGNTYSMGAHYEAYRCSKSGMIVRPGGRPSPHTKPGIPLYRDETGALIYRQLLNIEGFECSRVGNPSYTSAVGDTVLSMQSHTSKR